MAITSSDIKTLRTESAAAGDMAQVQICDAALRGDVAAIAECQSVIDTAAAMGEVA